MISVCCHWLKVVILLGTYFEIFIHFLYLLTIPPIPISHLFRLPPLPYSFFLYYFTRLNFPHPSTFSSFPSFFFSLPTFTFFLLTHPNFSFPSHPSILFSSICNFILFLFLPHFLPSFHFLSPHLWNPFLFTLSPILLLSSYPPSLSPSLASHPLYNFSLILFSICIPPQRTPSPPPPPPTPPLFGENP